MFDHNHSHSETEWKPQALRPAGRSKRSEKGRRQTGSLSLKPLKRSSRRPSTDPRDVACRSCGSVVPCAVRCPSKQSIRQRPGPAPRWPDRQVLFVHSNHSRSSPSATTATVPPSARADICRRRRAHGRTQATCRPADLVGRALRPRRAHACKRENFSCVAAAACPALQVTVAFARSQPGLPMFLPRLDAWCVCRLLSQLAISTAPLS